jgi:hypothetical protein
MLAEGTMQAVQGVLLASSLAFFWQREQSQAHLLAAVCQAAWLNSQGKEISGRQDLCRLATTQIDGRCGEAFQVPIKQYTAKCTSPRSRKGGSS